MSLGRHSWRFKSKLHMDKESFGDNTQQTCPNTEATIANISTQTPSNCHHVTCCCGKDCKGLRGLKMHQRNCPAIKDLHGETFEVMQENMSEHSDHNIDFELDAQYEREMPNIKRGIKLPKSDEQWSTANLFFLNALPTSGINSSNLNESIQLLNAIIYTYFEENFGYSDEVYNEELINKYKDMPNRSLKTNSKLLKQTQASPLEIKYVSRLLRNKLRNTTGKPTSEIDHNEKIKKNFWGYVKADLKHSSSLSPSFDTEICRTFSLDFFRSNNSSKSFTIPDLIPSLSPPVVSYNLSPPSYQQITKIVRRMKASGSPCPLDKIYIIPFKRCPYLRSYITEVIRLILISGNTPDEWKKACTVLIYKKGDTSDPSNFRPITLESVPLKILTSCMRDSMFSFLCSNGYIEHKTNPEWLSSQVDRYL